MHRTTTKTKTAPTQESAKIDWRPRTRRKKKLATKKTLLPLGSSWGFVSGLNRIHCTIGSNIVGIVPVKPTFDFEMLQQKAWVILNGQVPFSEDLQNYDESDVAIQAQPEVRVH